MKKFFLCLLAAALFSTVGCKKSADDFSNISSPRTAVPDEMVGTWAITSSSGTTVFSVSNGVHNAAEAFMGYTINKDGSIKQYGYMSTYSYGAVTWTRWTAVGSVEIEGDALSFHRVRGSYTSSRNSGAKDFTAAELYPNKTVRFEAFEVGTDSQGRPALLLLDENGNVRTYTKQ